MRPKQLLEPGDTVTLEVVRACRVMPGDVYWGVEVAPGKPRKGFVLESEGVPVPAGAMPHPNPDFPDLVVVASSTMEPDVLVLIQKARP
jgi:hypothetical protein